MVFLFLSKLSVKLCVCVAYKNAPYKIRFLTINMKNMPKNAPNKQKIMIKFNQSDKNKIGNG